MDLRGSTYQKKKKEKTLKSLIKEVEMVKMTLRVPSKLHREVKAACSIRNTRVTSVVIEGMQNYLTAFEEERDRQDAERARQKEERKNRK